MIKRAVITACATVLFTVAANCEEIQGAFGISLGDEFDPSSAVGKNSLTDGTPMYAFAPKSPYHAFSEYYVIITPRTNKIHSIWAIGRFSEEAKAENEKQVLLELLTRKYGTPVDPPGFSAIFTREKVISLGERYIRVAVNGGSKASLEARYCDKSLEALAEKERIEIEAGKADPSGL